jgi:Ca2+-transporting ATPase
MEGLDDVALSEQLRQITVCARISPHHKLRIVQALQAQGEVVAMTGDGLNDAPTLKAAQVGSAVRARGTDVARAAADLVLVDDNFAPIVRTIRFGSARFRQPAKNHAVHLCHPHPDRGPSADPRAHGLATPDAAPACGWNWCISRLVPLPLKMKPKTPA